MTGFSGFLVAQPVWDLILKRHMRGTVRGSSSTVAYVDVAGMVIGITAKTVPPMPNGISVTEQKGLRVFELGSRVEFGPKEITSGDASVSFGGRRLWDPRIGRWRNPEGLLAIGERIWGSLSLAEADDPKGMVKSLTQAGYESASSDDGRAGLEALFCSLIDRDIEFIRSAARLLIGRGPGLTPEGDDFLAAAAATIYACAPAVSWPRDGIATWPSALLPDDLGQRTTALSATLLELAADGNVSKPVQTLFDRTTSADEWLEALERLVMVGHGTGRAWAAGCAAATILLTS